MSETRNGSVGGFSSGDAMQPHQPSDEQPEMRLPPRGKSVVVVFMGLPLLYWLATIAFTPAGMQRVTTGVAGHILWITGSPDGNRVGSFVLFGVGIVLTIGVIRGTVIRNYGLGAFGKIEFLLGTALLCGTYFEWHLNQIGLLVALGTGWGAYILVVWGWRNIQNDQGPTYVPQFQAQALPEQSVHGDARNPFPDEIHNGLRDDRSGGGLEERFDD